MGSRAASMLALGILAVGALGASRAGRGAGRLSEQDRDPGGALSARRRRRRAGARGRRKALRRARPSGDRRQSRRRLGPRRHPRADPQRARRLHAVPRPHRLDLDQPEPLRQCRLRSAQGLHRDRAVRLDAGRAAGASELPGQDHRRGGRAREEGGRQAQHRHLGGRHRRLSLGRAVQVDHRRAGDHRALQGHRAADERSARRPCADGVRRAAAGDGQSRRRHAARHRHARQAALQPAAQHSDLARVGAAGLRVGAALRRARSGRHAEADRRQAQRRDERRSPTPTR